MSNSPILFEKSDNFPKGYLISGWYHVFSIDDSLQSLSIFSKFDRKEILIQQLNLNQNTDKIHYVDYILDDVLFIYATKSQKSIGFFLNINLNQQNYILPPLVEFSLTSLTFHSNILSAFVPHKGSFVVVSKNGISCHDLYLNEYFSIRSLITSCRFVRNYLVYTDNLFLHACSIDLNDKNRVFFNKINSRQLNTLGNPLKLLALSHCLLIIFETSEKATVVQKVLLQSKKFDSITNISKYFLQNNEFSNISFNIFDNALLIYHRPTQKFTLIDMYDADDIQIFPPFDCEFPILEILDSSKAFSDEFMLDTRCNYQVINVTDLNIIAALFRRTNTLTHSIFLLSNLLKGSVDVETMNKIIQTIGPSARSPSTQIRFVKAIQFSGIVDPHLILLALLRYSKILGDDMIDDAKISVIQAAFHPYCRNTLKDMFSLWKLKMNDVIMKYIVTKLDESYWYGIEMFGDILKFAKICTDVGKSEIARKMIIKFVLDGGESSENFTEIRQNYISKFGEDPLIPMSQKQ
ncbi:hypothetical protein TVAG_484160 [Trichomonas vaginalis G3]|uniref:Mic1 domain-containing protein n=1 Tax=Trichomonas vaginalis (strain ATCC PRA-98 / G3) TaxID=412133 RepID=A2EA59_TRIV3|nr:hypothetical protein TVAGG3_0980650 [Trichomonas vaginalis G3]EAY10505.1 hypothetical protein TVAG_484160 [Trichomonas vaginalis G3]KAI5489267.1 hypothetical protein TVAGG3_0980650 [Trichomonas vaginalis G3]|eukprot:XP_001322728.1 hypothetical protein [Trichomonas vaginalis G3]